MLLPMYQSSQRQIPGGHSILGEENGVSMFFRNVVHTVYGDNPGDLFFQNVDIQLPDYMTS
jgi:hypothetical protein